MRSEMLGRHMTSCGVCGNVIYGTPSLGRGVILDSKDQATVTGKRVEYDGYICWVHYPGPCWAKAAKTECIVDFKRMAANDRED